MLIHVYAAAPILMVAKRFKLQGLWFTKLVGIRSCYCKGSYSRFCLRKDHEMSLGLLGVLIDEDFGES